MIQMLVTMADFWCLVICVSMRHVSPQTSLLVVREQDSFMNEPGSATLLAKLHDYMKACDKVVAFIGTRSGSSPPAAAAAEFRQLLPDDLKEPRYVTEPSYTRNGKSSSHCAIVGMASWQFAPRRNTLRTTRASRTTSRPASSTG
jgi:hypothetical protein